MRYAPAEKRPFVISTINFEFVDVENTVKIPDIEQGIRTLLPDVAREEDNEHTGADNTSRTGGLARKSVG